MAPATSALQRILTPGGRPPVLRLIPPDQPGPRRERHTIIDLGKRQRHADRVHVHRTIQPLDHVANPVATLIARPHDHFGGVRLTTMM
jgi:hypothetical protein